ncbi:MAG: inner membrane CreD family protein [Myxococcota bacterium]|nr:inner membrane CreD family protein [Myxococcota bacterium]
MKTVIALSAILIGSWIGWLSLSAAMDYRTDSREPNIANEVGHLWGTNHTQAAPQVEIAWQTITRREFTEKEKRAYEESKRKEAVDEAAKLGHKHPREIKIFPDELFEINEEHHQQNLPLSSTDVDVDLGLQHRRRGLLWFSTYTVGFAAQYTVVNPIEQPVTAQVIFPFPSSNAVYDNMTVTAPGCEDLLVTTEGDKMIGTFTLPARTDQMLSFSYQSRGMDQWSYRFGSSVHMVENLKVVMRTDFNQIDFPLKSISPDDKERRADGAGWILTWDKRSLVSGLEIGMLTPQKLNPGPLASAMSMHAPISLFFFFFVMFILQSLRRLEIHPMNYFFLATSFFAFNLLFSYLVDHISIIAAFSLSSAVSLLLVFTYLKRLVGTRFALLEAGGSQLIYQVLFSLAHFFEGYTGLTITIGAILTLAVVMHLTTRLDWTEVLTNKTRCQPEKKLVKSTP